MASDATLLGVAILALQLALAVVNLAGALLLRNVHKEMGAVRRQVNSLLPPDFAADSTPTDPAFRRLVK